MDNIDDIPRKKVLKEFEVLAITRRTAGFEAIKLSFASLASLAFFK